MIFISGIFLSVARLLYAQRLARHGPDFLLGGLEGEDQVCGDGWLRGPQADVQWMGGYVDLSARGYSWHELKHAWKSLRPGRKHLVKTASLKRVWALKLLGKTPKPHPQSDRDRTEFGCLILPGRSQLIGFIHSGRAPEFALVSTPLCSANRCFAWPTAMKYQEDEPRVIDM